MICAIHSRGSMPPVNGPYKAAGPARRGSRNPAPGAAGPEPPPGMCWPPRAAHAENLGPTGAVGPSASTEDGTRTREPGLCRRHVVLPAWALPPGASAPSGVRAQWGHRRRCSARDAAWPQETPAARASRAWPRGQASGPWGPGHSGPRGPSGPVSRDRRRWGGTLTTAIKAPDGGGLAWGRPMRGPLGLQGPEPHSPHTLAQAEQQEWRGCCRLSQGSDVGLCRAPPEGQWHSRRTAGGWPAPRAGGRPGRAGGQCGEALALTPVREVE